MQLKCDIRFNICQRRHTAFTVCTTGIR